MRRRRHRRRRRRSSSSKWTVGAQIFMMFAVLLVIFLFRDYVAVGTSKAVTAVAGDEEAGSEESGTSTEGSPDTPADRQSDNNSAR